jgi:hypothetical protein
MALPAKAQPTIFPTPNNNEVNLVDFASTAPYTSGYTSSPAATGGYNLMNSTSFTPAANDMGAGPGFVSPTGQQSILDRLYGKGNYVQVATQQLPTNPNGIALMATVKYAGANSELGYYAGAGGANPVGSVPTAFKEILQVSGVSSAGFYSQGGLTVTPGGGATMVGTNSFLLTPTQSGSPFEWGLFNGTNYFSSNQNSAVTGLTDQGASGFQHLAEFQITGGANAGAIVLAWEDSPLSMSPHGPDYDYNDLVVQINLVPEPSSMAIAGLGALALIGYGLRRRKAQGA